MDEELYERLQEAIENNKTEPIENYVKTLDIDEAMGFILVDDFGGIDIVSSSLQIANNFLNKEDILEKLNQIANNMPFSYEEIKIIFIWSLANLLNDTINHHQALNNGYYYEEYPEDYGYNGPKNRVFDDGYEKYMYDHIHSKDLFLDKIIEQCKGKTK